MREDIGEKPIFIEVSIITNTPQISLWCILGIAAISEENKATYKIINTQTKQGELVEMIQMNLREILKLWFEQVK